MKPSVVAVLRVCAVVFDASSVITCARLLWRVPAANRRFLLPKQIVNLALADALVCSTELVLDLKMATGLVTITRLNRFLSNVEMIFLWASLLLEVHISAGFLAVFWRKPTLLMFLKRTVWLTWVIATFMSSVSGFIHFKWGNARYKEFFCFGTATALVITTAMYVAVWFRSLFSPFREEQRAQRMLSLYTATFLITYVPTILCFHYHIRLMFTGPFIALNGVLNVLLYSCHTRFSGSVWRDMQEEPGTPLAQWGGRSSLPVGFSMSEPLKVHVPAVQRTALEESEREIADIERTQADLHGEQLMCSGPV